ncbi:hypothetical protein D3C85_1746380 [compost metagenome]
MGLQLGPVERLELVRPRVGDIPLERLVALRQFRLVEAVLDEDGAVVAKGFANRLIDEHEVSPSIYLSGWSQTPRHDLAR